MSAIITETFRRNMRDLLEQDMIDNSYYVGIGKSNSWEPNITGNVESSTTFSVPIPKGTPADDLETKNNLITLIKIDDENISAAIPKVVWKSGNKYKAYNPYDETCFYSDSDEEYPCYAINESLPNKPLFLCIKAGTVIDGDETVAGASTVAPSITTYGHTPTVESVSNDGYVWVYIQDYINQDDTVNSSSFLQIYKNSLIERSAAANTIAACKEAFGGKIYGFTIVNGGSGYDPAKPPGLFISIKRKNPNDSEEETSDYTLTSSIKLKPIIKNITINEVPVNGVITGLTFDDNQSFFTLLNDTTNNNIISASIEIIPGENTTGSGALIVPHISPFNGFGFKPSLDFPGWYLGVYTKLEDNTSDSFYLPYRQISILKNPIQNQEVFGDPGDGNIAATQPTLNALQYFVLDGIDINDLPSDIVGLPIRLVEPGLVTNPIIGYADFAYDDIDANEFRLYFHQTYSSGFGHIPTIPVSSGGVSDNKIIIGNSTIPISWTSLEIGEYVRNSGEVIFVENRKPIVRTAQQAEELKIIIQL